MRWGQCKCGHTEDRHYIYEAAKRCSVRDCGCKEFSDDEQVDVFDVPLHTRATNPETSAQAAELMRRPLTHLRRMAYLAVQEAGTRGICHGEMNALFGWVDAQDSRRLHELRKAGLILRVKRTRTYGAHHTKRRVYVTPDNLLTDDRVD